MGYQNPAPPDFAAVVGGVVEGGVVAAGELLIWVRVLPPLDPHAAAPTPSIATNAIGALRIRILRRVLALILLIALSSS